MKRIILYFAAILGMVTACTEKIDVKLDKTYTRLVVEGSITTDTMAHTVTLTKTADYFANQIPPAVTGAKVTVTDGDITDTLRETSPGVYQTRPDYFGVVGHTYVLTIKLPEPINGNTEYSASSYLPAVASLDSLSFEFHKKYFANIDFWEVKVFAFDPPNENYYMFKTFNNNRLLTDTINKFTISDDRLFNGNFVNGFGVVWLSQDRNDYKLTSGDTVKVMIAGITKEYYHFIMDVQTETGFQLSLFSGPPANVKGNINNGGIGFFAAYATKYKSRILRL